MFFIFLKSYLADFYEIRKWFNSHFYLQKQTNVYISCPFLPLTFKKNLKNNVLWYLTSTIFLLLFQAREEFHAQLAMNRTHNHIQSTDLMDDNELLSDDRDLDADLTGK